MSSSVVSAGSAQDALLTLPGGRRVTDGGPSDTNECEPISQTPRFPAESSLGAGAAAEFDQLVAHHLLDLVLEAEDEGELLVGVLRSRQT